MMQDEVIYTKDDVIIEQDSPNQSEFSSDDFLAVLPLKNVILLPKSILPIIVGRPISIKAVNYAIANKKPLFITAQKDSSVENPTFDDLLEDGVRATILQVMRMPSGALKILAEGISRSKIVAQRNDQEFLAAECQDIATTNVEQTVEVEAMWRHLKELYETYAKFSEKAPANLMSMTNSVYDIDAITDTLAVHINLSFEERLAILRTPDLKQRLSMLSTSLQKEIEILQTEQRIRGHIQSQVEKNQREYYLTEQIKAIHKELGNEDQQAELNQLKTKVEKAGLPKEALERANKEIKRLEQMPALSAEAAVSRHYVDWLISLPWTNQSNDDISITQAQEILQSSHSGLEKPKERIIEFLAAKKFSKNLRRSPIICLVGPPGVGKTSLGKSVAESMGREFVRISLGGVRDEAEIRGHRRTYIGSLPGKILQAMRKAKTVNPVILLDEIDKMSRDMHGDPSAALLEVLDPEQNRTFVDHFLEVEYDLSNVMFLTTANGMDTIPYPLYDRMEIISLSGYTEKEKLDIARKFLIPKALKEHDLKTKQFRISDTELLQIVEQYTKEAGVRQLERVLTKLMRKSIQELLKDSSKKIVIITPERIKKWLGYPKYKKTSLDTNKNRIGLATGLAWTEYGGDMLEIETTTLPGKGNVTLTGQLGEVMQESAHAAISYIRSRCSELGLSGSFHANKDIHVHLPEGATPKDGPSAGITMCTALVSALTKNPTKNTTAMTGEITLRGRVLGVGGLKEKLLAAKQHGCKTVLVPKENTDDIAEIPAHVKEGLSVHFVETMDEVLKLTLEKNPFTKKKKKARKKTAVKKAKS